MRAWRNWYRPSTKIFLDFQAITYYNIFIMNTIVDEICNNLEINDIQWFVKPRSRKKGISVKEIIEAILIYENGPEAIKFLGYSAQTFNRNIRKLFPDVKLNGGNENWFHFLLRNSNYKKCPSCCSILDSSNFYKDKNKSRELSTYCKNCKSEINKDFYDKYKDTYHKKYIDENRADYNYRNALRKAQILKATPKWVDLNRIREIYRNCPKGYHVDHIIPLRGENVCGLHVETNLQYLTAEENLKKGNKLLDV